MSERPILKSPEEIARMRPACRLTAQAMQVVERMIAPGVSTLEIDQAVEKVIRQGGGEPAFLGYPSASRGVIDYPASICASINEEVVHGIPSAKRFLREGDLVSVDLGVRLDDFYGDMARTFCVGAPSRKAEKLLRAGREALEAAIRLMKPGVKLSRIGAAVESRAKEDGFEVVRQFVGHGIGRDMHEPPQVPNFTRRTTLGDQRLDTGTVLAIEPMINAGVSEVKVLEDGWTVVTVDGKPSVHFEDTVAIGSEGPLVLTVV